MKKRLLGPSVAMILCINSLLPAGCFGAPAPGSTGREASGQQPLFQLCSSVHSPFRVMNDIVNTALPLGPGFTSPLSRAPAADTAVNGACSLNSSGSRLQGRDSAGSPVPGNSFAVLTDDRCFSPPGPPPGGFLCLFLLVYLVLLSRSNLPWAIRNFGVEFFARHAGACRVFLRS